jgi:ring-1,2-phenylacetyl-CoA epoxidase subunit PaaE
LASHFRTLSIEDIRQETPDCVSISFSIPEEFREEFRFIQGQSISVRTKIAGEEIRRSYSICSSPLDNELRVAVKRIENGKFSNYANSDLKKGTALDVLPPTGKFYTELRPSNRKKYLAFGAGSGITPLLSILKTTLATEPHSQFTLIYGNRNRNSVIFREPLEALKNRYLDRLALHYLFSRDRTEAAVNHGRINAEKCRELSGKLIQIENTDEFFICGPEEMLFSVKNWLEENKIPPEKIHIELFNAPLAKQSPTLVSARPAGELGKTTQVTLKLDGISFEFGIDQEGESILEAALKQGADLPYACKSGVCCSCRARLLKGEVRMDVNYGLEPEEIRAGFILTCQSHPITDQVSVDFDSK